ncbi:hypothetical protein Cgig2_005847 [Carnegiea gigantea]|uniref:Glyoxal oxidase N-terminal domain-containing protein n=1 Tax=Carnegiea gigantea TaxID=171969 RepID=A0A9Q1KP62_9CARY|nr:hypothetical protein Cgig2_005847 [Carnegiea gigantea]
MPSCCILSSPHHHTPPPPPFFRPSITTATASHWRLLQRSIGVSAMHMQLLSDDTVIIFTAPTSAPPTSPSTPATAAATPSTARPTRPSSTRPPTPSSHSPSSLTPGAPPAPPSPTAASFRPATSMMATVSYAPSTPPTAPTGRIPHTAYSLAGGTPPTTSSLTVRLPMLVETNDPKIENNLHPFVSLNVDGNLFIFANNRAILFDYADNKVIRTYPQIPGGDPRNYLSSGSAGMLPLKNLEGPNVEVEVL